MRMLVRATFIAGVALALPADGRGQVLPVSDALECFKVTARTASDDATLTLAPLHADVPGGPCTVRARIRFVCTPVSRTPSSTTAAPIVSDFTCYKMRCPATPRPADRPVSDDLAANVPTSHYTPQLVCLPAQLGSTSTTTTSTSTSTSTLPPTPCGQRTNQCATGSTTCPAGQECASVGPAQCACIDQLPKGCGDTPYDQCVTGACQSGQGLVCKSVGAVCACMDPSVVACGDAPAPQCDGVCPNNGSVCMTFGTTCSCWFDFGPCGQSAVNGGAPECNGRCDSPAAPYCRDVGGTCQCAP